MYPKWEWVWENCDGGPCTMLYWVQYLVWAHVVNGQMVKMVGLDGEEEWGIGVGK